MQGWWLWMGGLLLSGLPASAGGQSYTVEVGSSTRCAGLVDIRGSGSRSPAVVRPGVPFRFFGSSVSAEATLRPKWIFSIELLWPVAENGDVNIPPLSLAKTGIIGVARAEHEVGLGLFHSGSYYYEVRGTAPERVIIFLWTYRWLDPLSGDFTDALLEAQISEGTGVIEFDYEGPLPPSRSGWVGLKSAFLGTELGFLSAADQLTGTGCVRWIPTATAAPADPYAVEGRSTPFVSILGTGQAAPLVRDSGAAGQPDFVGHAVLGVPFPFGVLGTSLTSSATVRADSRGSLWLGGTRIAALSGPGLVGSNILAEVSGPVGDRTWTIEWSGVQHVQQSLFIPSDRVDLQIRVHERSSQIELAVDHVSSSGANVGDWGADAAFGSFGLCASYSPNGDPACGIAGTDSIAQYGTLSFTPNETTVTALRLVRTSTIPRVAPVGSRIPIGLDLSNSGGAVLGAEVIVLLDGVVPVASTSLDLLAGERVQLTLTATLPLGWSGAATLTALVDPKHELPEQDRSDDRALIGGLFVGVPPPIELVTTTLMPATVNSAYRATLEARGGVGPLRFMLSGAPPGLMFDAGTRVLSGAPIATGTSTLTFSVDDEAGQSAARELRFEVLALPTLALVTVALPSGRVGDTYSAEVMATGGVQPLAWTAAPLPAGLGFDAAAERITGTPSTPGTTMVVLRVTDGAGQEATRTLPLVVESAPSVPLAIVGKSLPNGRVGVPYDAEIAVEGGMAPVVLSATGLPAGFVLGSAAHVLGTPTTAATAMVEVTAVDAAGTRVTATLSLRVDDIIPVPLGNGGCGCAIATTPAGSSTPLTKGGDVLVVFGVALGILFRRRR